MASRSPAGKPRPAGSPQPAHMLFQVGGQGFLLTRRFSRPAWARLIDSHQASSLPLLRQAARESVTFAARLRSTFGHDVAPLASRGRPADALERVAALIGQRRLFLFRLGEAPAAPPKRVSQLRIDVVPAKPVAPESDAAPAPRDLPSRMLIVVEGMRDVPARELGEDAVELFATLAVAGMALRIAALLAAWIASHFTPVGWIVDVGMIGYGVWMVGVGFVDSMKRLLVIARDIQAARTRGELKRLSQPLAVLLVEAGLTAMLAFFLKGVDKRKRGSGVSREGAAEPSLPRQQRAQPVPGSATRSVPNTGSLREGTGFRGSKGYELANTKYQPVRNAAREINGRQYSGHALDQMQNRGIMPSVVEETLKHGVPFPTRIGTAGMYDAANGVRVITNSATGRVVTVIRGGP